MKNKGGFGQDWVWYKPAAVLMNSFEHVFFMKLDMLSIINYLYGGRRMILLILFLLIRMHCGIKRTENVYIMKLFDMCGVI